MNGQEEEPADFMARLKIRRSALPAVTHVDYSARVQTVARGDNPRFHQLLGEFEKRTGCPVLVNTSFNVRGEPPVCTPEDAYRCFMRTEMDCLVLGNFLLDKAAMPASASRSGGLQTAEPKKTAIWRAPLLEQAYAKLDQSPRALRRFGIIVGAALLLLGKLLLLGDRNAGGPFLSLGALLILVAAFAPSVLRYIHKPWMTIAFAMSWLVTRIILTLLFFLVVTPVGLLQRLCGKRPLEFRFKSGETSYWQDRSTHSVPADYERQF